MYELNVCLLYGKLLLTTQTGLMKSEVIYSAVNGDIGILIRYLNVDTERLVYYK
jgi:hypothetical protein